MVSDLKKHGFDLEASHLRQFLRLSRLTPAVAFLYVWLTTAGEALLRSANTFLVARRHRRDLSIFRLGFDFVCRCLALDNPLPPCRFPAFNLVSGG
jgi:hypothetical protein